tara:strand:- start:3168 stop:3959 length:792 start_codon:yes stop_codon:yes gene_type:complete
MSMVQDGHQLQSEIKTPTGNHVLVDYSAGTYGDFLRYFISQHDTFEPFTLDVQATGTKSHVRNRNFPIYHIPSNTLIDFFNIKNLKDFVKKFKIAYPNCNKYRQCYKVTSYHSQFKKIIKENKDSIHFHSVVGATWLEDGAIVDNKVFKWDYSDYEIIRQTDHKIIFVILSPFSKYKDHYLNRHIIWSSHKPEYDSDTHEACWKRNYIKNDYPIHELNYEIEINNLLDKDDETYYNLIKFLDVKPIDNWKDYVDTFDRHVLSK